jgi:hypothetical protein
MSKLRRPNEEANLCDLRHARWLIGVLEMLIRVVGRQSLLGIILQQTRSEIASLVSEEPSPCPADLTYLNN